MRAIIASVILAAAAQLAAVSPAQAQQELRPCADAETLQTCLNRYFDEISKSAARAAAERRPKGEPAGGIDPAVRSSVKDFLPPFAGGFSQPTGAGKSDMSAEYNFAALHGRWKVRGTLADPKPYKPLIERVAQNARADANRQVSESLRAIDDATLHISWSLVNRRFGRSLGPHGALLDTLIAAANPPRTSPYLDIGPLVRRANQSIRADQPEVCRTGNIADRPMSCFAADFRAHASAELLRVVRAAAARDAGVQNALEAAGVFMIPYLVNAKPQLNLSVEYRNRRDLVGADAFFAELSLESGEIGIADLYAFCDSVMNDGLKLAGCVGSFVSNKGVLASLRSRPRFALAVSYARTDSLAVLLPAFNAVLHERKGDIVKVSASVGRYIGVPREGTANAAGRIDGSAEYIWNSNDDEKNPTRLIGSLGYTHRVSDGASFTIGLALATKSEFRGEVDWPLSARAGLKFKLLGKN